jgi:hypothetical protein
MTHHHHTKLETGFNKFIKSISSPKTTKAIGKDVKAIFTSPIVKEAGRTIESTIKTPRTIMEATTKAYANNANILLYAALGIGAIVVINKMK